MESNPTSPTIAELWREFQKTLKHKPAMYISHAAHKGMEVTRYAKHIAEAATKYAALRAQLIERCKRVPDQDGDLTTLRLVCNRDRIATEPCGILHRVDNSKTAREMSAAYAFWAWELEQREKEAQP